MPLPKKVREEVEHLLASYCENRVLEHARHQVKMSLQFVEIPSR